MYHGWEEIPTYLSQRLLNLMINNNVSDKNTAWLYFAAIGIARYIGKIVEFLQQQPGEIQFFENEATAFKYADEKLGSMVVIRRFMREQTVLHFKVQETSEIKKPFQFNIFELPKNIFIEQFKLGCIHIATESRIFDETNKIIGKIVEKKIFTDEKINTFKNSWGKFVSGFFDIPENPISTPDTLIKMKKTAEQWFSNVLIFCKDAFTWDDFVIYKKLKGDYVNATTKPEHVQLAERMEARAKGRGPKKGESVGICYILNDQAKKKIDGNNEVKVADIIDDIDYCKQEKLKVNLDKYIGDSLYNSIESAFTPIIMQDSRAQVIIETIVKAIETFQNQTKFGKRKLITSNWKPTTDLDLLYHWVAIPPKK
jgi:hypothetical protein